VIAVVLAAGKGTRMGELTRTIPKPLVPVAGVPSLERIILGLKSAGFSEFVIVTGYLGSQVREYFASGDKLGVKIVYVHQEVQEGTARALLLCREACDSNDLLLTFADIITSAENYKRIRESFYRYNCDVIGGIRRVDDPHKGAAVYLDKGWNILRMIEKPPRGTSTTPWNHAGMYCFNSEIFKYLKEIQPSPRGEYEIADAVTQMIADGKTVKAIELTSYWNDLATPEDVQAAEGFLA
jgi:UDP-N-acetylglucosamine diphosphorylase / glucose-1-phosphate thymidylyltransferase / UDP-N-acetylgalactosamine diphosphorylase / glucosamine-1-phosphate N-acetyltransferase / galactosamine-1-phosphate N-acetyltransferase